VSGSVVDILCQTLCIVADVTDFVRYCVTDTEIFGGMTDPIYDPSYVMSDYHDLLY